MIDVTEALTVLKKPFHAGTRVINCIAHSDMRFDARPDICKLCATDIRNRLSLVCRVNEFMNAKIDAAIVLLEKPETQQDHEKP